MILNVLKLKNEHETHRGKRAMNPQSVSHEERHNQNNLLLTTKELSTESLIERIVETVRRRRKERNLYGRSPRKV